MGQVCSMITHEETGLINRIVNEVYGLYCSVRNKSEQLTREDLLHYGIQGLLEARSRFDRSKNVPWLVYATYRVRGVMLDHIRKLPLVRLPYGRYKKLKELVDTKLELLKLHGQVSSDMLAEKLGIEQPHKHVAAGMGKRVIKAKIRELKKERVAAMEAGQVEDLRRVRKEIHRRKRRLRRMMQLD